MTREWTEKEDDIIYEHGSTYSALQLQVYYFHDRSTEEIQERVDLLTLASKDRPRKLPWTITEDAMIRKGIKEGLTVEQMWPQFPSRTLIALKGRASALNALDSNKQKVKTKLTNEQLTLIYENYERMDAKKIKLRLLPEVSVTTINKYIKMYDEYGIDARQEM